MDPDTPVGAAPRPEAASSAAAKAAAQPTWSERFRRQDKLIATLAVTVVAIAALAAVLTARHTEERFRQASPSASSTAIATAPAGASSSTPQNVVQAPPLADPSRRTRNPTSAMGAAPALCRSCGVVESVVAVQGTTRGKAQAVGFLMNIRMDDGSARTVEQRGALAAGSRVTVEGETVRIMMPPAGS